MSFPLPPPPTILLLGKDGQVGWELQRSLRVLGPLVAAGRADADLGDDAALRALVRRTAPDIIVNAAGYTAVDAAETETERAFALNAHAPGVLAEAARGAGALLVHYSTDYVFDGTKRTPYTEADPPAPINAYGCSKLAGEEAIQRIGGDHLILRTSWVYSPRRRNFFTTMLRLARQQVPLRVIHTQIGAPTPAQLIAEATACLLSRRLLMPADARPTGLFHLTAAGHTSWHGFTEAIFAHLYGEQAPPVEPITPEDYPTPATRPDYSVLSCDKLTKTFGLTLPAWDDALAAVCAEFQAHHSLAALLPSSL